MAVAVAVPEDSAETAVIPPDVPYRAVADYTADCNYSSVDNMVDMSA